MKKMFPVMMDLHNHSVFSDGVHTIDELVDNAIKSDVKILGVTDHYELVEDFENYLNTLIIKANEFKEKIQVLKGIEIDVSTLMSLIENDNEILNKFDYVLIENIEYFSNQDKLYNAVVEYLEKYDVQFGIAHINLEKMKDQFGNEGMTNFFNFIEKNQIFWEINTNYNDEFYDRLLNDEKMKLFIDRIINYEIKISVGSDTHSLEPGYYYRILRGNQFAEEISNNKSV